MFIHVVLMDLKRSEDIEPALAALRGLEGRIPALRSIEVGRHDGRDPRGADICLITRHEDAEGLRAYAQHPAHLQVVAYLKTVLDSSRVVDWAP